MRYPVGMQYLLNVFRHQTNLPEVRKFSATDSEEK